MGVNRVKRSIYQHLTCPSCKKLFSQPYILPCNHSVCKHCIGVMKKKASCDGSKAKTVRCPVCSVEHCCAQNSTLDFPENHVLGNIVRRQCEEQAQSKNNCPQRKQPLAGEQFVNCELCLKDKKPSERFCKTCSLNFCKKCLRKLHNNPAFQSHTLIEPAKKLGELACFYHPGKILTHYSFTDGRTVCEECTNVTSDTAVISEAYVNKSRGLHAALDQAVKAKELCQSDIREIGFLKSRLKPQMKELNRRVTEGFKDLHKKLTEKEEEIKGVIEKLYKETEEDAEQLISDSSKHVYILEGLVQFSHESLKEKNETVFLQGVDNTIYQICKVLDANCKSCETLKQEPLKNITVDFKSITDGLSKLYTEHINYEKPTKKFAAPGTITTSRASLNGSAVPVGGQPVESTETEEQKQNSENSKDSVTSPQPKPEITVPRENQSKSNKVRFRTSSSDKLKHENQKMSLDVYNDSNGCSTTANVCCVFLSQIIWMFPIGEGINSFDVHFQEVVSLNSTMDLPQDQGKLVSGIEKCSYKAECLNPNAQYIFTVRSQNTFGEGPWSHAYRVRSFHSVHRGFNEKQIK
ncbi:TRI42 protein, partial [Amia calva]|nr:TRI42 protein [Amia calva]